MQLFSHPFVTMGSTPFTWFVLRCYMAEHNTVCYSCNVFAEQSQNYARDTPSILVTSRWELPSADNLTIRCSTCCGKFCGMIPLKVQWNINSLYRNPTLHNCIKVVMPRQTSLQVTTPELTFFTSLESQWSPDSTDCVWPFNLVT